MAFEIVTKPLLSLPVEAVVNRANSGLQYASGLCGEIFDAAGKIPLQRACVAIGSCPVGEPLPRKDSVFPQNISSTPFLPVGAAESMGKTDCCPSVTNPS